MDSPAPAFRDIDAVFAALPQSSFRMRFHLRAQERLYIAARGLPRVIEHARGFITQRLAPAQPRNDGKQTPWRGHPVFIAQHATGTCCRGCLAKWHAIPRGAALSAEEQEHVIAVLERWLNQEMLQD